jgi:dTDP-4-amino-4,6-dideoxygalactose transaminase
VSNPFDAVDAFERDLAVYAGSKYAVSCTSCTEALLLCCAYLKVREVEIPSRTYVGVAQSILNAGGTVKFRDEAWEGIYQLAPYSIFDAARRFRALMHAEYPFSFMCVSFHASKILGHTDGGAILHSDDRADPILRKMRFDGRTAGVHPRDDEFVRGFHCYMAPSTAAALHRKLAHMPADNADLPRSDYSDLSLAPIFGGSGTQVIAEATE